MGYLLRSLGYLVGLLGGVLVLIGGFLALARGGDSRFALGESAGSSLFVAILLVFAGVFAIYVVRRGRHFWGARRTVTSGILLVALAVVIWLIAGPIGGLVVLAGAIFVLLAGLLYLTRLTSLRLRLFAGI